MGTGLVPQWRINSTRELKRVFKEGHMWNARVYVPQYTGYLIEMLTPSHTKWKNPNSTPYSITDNSLHATSMRSPLVQQSLSHISADSLECFLRRGRLYVSAYLSGDSHRHLLSRCGRTSISVTLFNSCVSEFEASVEDFLLVLHSSHVF